jgi:hypothetical protein
VFGVHHGDLIVCRSRELSAASECLVRTTPCDAPGDGTRLVTRLCVGHLTRVSGEDARRGSVLDGLAHNLIAEGVRVGPVLVHYSRVLVTQCLC